MVSGESEAEAPRPGRRERIVQTALMVILVLNPGAQEPVPVTVYCDGRGARCDEPGGPLVRDFTAGDGVVGWWMLLQRLTYAHGHASNVVRGVKRMVGRMMTGDAR